MKKLLTGILVLGFVSTLIAQDKPVQADLSAMNQPIELLKSNNSKYLKHVNHEDAPKIAVKLQHMVATYDIKQNELYNPNRTKSYEVVFEESNNRIVATYDNDGKLINTVEEFNNMRLPYKLTKEISKQYPQWQFLDNKQVVEYTSENGAFQTYSIKIKKDGVVKELKFQLVNKPKTNYLAIN